MTRPQTETPASSPLKRVNSESTPEHDLFRIKKRPRGWEPVSRALITDVRLQFGTRGFAAWLLAKPPGWEIRAGALPYLLKKERGPGEHIGRDKVRRFFRELEAAGYVTRRRMRKADGQWRWQIEFTDTPPTAPTHPGTVDGSAVDGSATGGTAVDGSGVDLLQTLNHQKRDQCKPTTTAAWQDDVAIGADPPGQLRYPDCLCSVPGYSRSKLLAACADRNFKRPSGPRLPTTFVARNQPYVASKLRSRVAGLENLAASRLRRRAFGRCRATKPASRAARMAPTPAFAEA